MSITAEIIKKIEEYDSIVIFTHKSPDFDAIGSQFGLAYSLRGTYPDKKIYTTGETADRYEGLVVLDNPPDDVIKESLAIAVDSAATHLLSDQRFVMSPFLIKIDHHIDREPFGDISYVDTTMSAACEMIADMIFTHGMHMDRPAAEMLMYGLVTDSGRFLYSTVSGRSFKTAERLMSYDIDLQSIYDSLYEEDISVKRLRGRFMTDFMLTENGVAYMKNDEDFVKASGMDAFTISRGMVNTMKDIKGVPIWVNFTQDTDGIIVDIRSKGHPVNEIASKYGGGGHRQAAGAMLDSWEQVDLMIADLDAMAVTSSDG
jgi:phosphoesterase RecJ-like protein